MEQKKVIGPSLPPHLLQAMSKEESSHEDSDRDDDIHDEDEDGNGDEPFIGPWMPSSSEQHKAASCRQVHPKLLGDATNT